MGDQDQRPNLGKATRGTCLYSKVQIVGRGHNYFDVRCSPSSLIITVRHNTFSSALIPIMTMVVTYTTFVSTLTSSSLLRTCLNGSFDPDLGYETGIDRCVNNSHQQNVCLSLCCIHSLASLVFPSMASRWKGFWMLRPLMFIFASIRVGSGAVQQYIFYASAPRSRYVISMFWSSTLSNPFVL